MGLIKDILGIGKAVGHVAEIFVPNKTMAQSQAHLRAIGAQAQFAAEFQKYLYPNVLFQSSTSPSSLPLLKDRFVEGETHLYVCENKVCYLPVQTLEEALNQIRELED